MLSKTFLLSASFDCSCFCWVTSLICFSRLFKSPVSEAIAPLTIPDSSLNAAFFFSTAEVTLLTAEAKLFISEISEETSTSVSTSGVSISLS